MTLITLCSAQINQQQGGNLNGESVPTGELIVEEDPVVIPENATEDLPDEIRDVYREYWRLIRTNKDKSDLLDHMYNFRVGKVENIPFADMLHDIYQQEPQTFRINAAPGYILKHVETEELRYFAPENNNHQIFERPKVITSSEDMTEFVDELENFDFENTIPNPDTKWVAVSMPNITFFVTPVTEFVAGCKDADLPALVSRQRNNLLTMQNDCRNNPFRDSLCFFRCLSQCLHGNIEKNNVETLFHTYCKQKGVPATVKDFFGVPLTEIEDGTSKHFLEKLFKVDIQLFNLTSKNTAACWKHVYPRRHEKLLNLDVCFPSPGRVHFSYIKHLDRYAKRYKCLDCKRLWKGKKALKKHKKEKKCKNETACKKGKTRHEFKGGIFKNSLTLFEQLEEEADIIVPKEIRFCEFVSVFDFESMLVKDGTTVVEKRLNFVVKHQPVSWAIHSNVPGFTEVKFHVNKNPDKLTTKFLQYLMRISEKQEIILIERYKDVFVALNEKIADAENCVRELNSEGKGCSREKGYVNFLKNLLRKVETYCSQLTVIGFNSKKYDLNLIKKHLYPKLVQQVRKLHTDPNQLDESKFGDNVDSDSDQSEPDSDCEEPIEDSDIIPVQESDDDEKDDTSESEEEEDDDDDVDEELEEEKQKASKLKWPTAIINNGSCICMTTPNLRFLDASNYLAAGSSLSSFLKMYKTELQKAKFPYDYFDSFEKLRETSLPPKEAFDDYLRNTSITVEDYNECIDIWKRKNMQTFADYLKFYNETDVIPFLTATLQMSSDYWNQFDVDIFREVVSLPGFTLRYLFKNISTPFSLFSKYDKELYYELKNSLLGGLSLVMNRLAIAGETKIRGSPDHIVQSIVG